MEDWEGQIEQHISDTNYGLLIWDLIEKRDTIVLATDLDGDRLTDLLADISDPLRAFGGIVAKHIGEDIDMWNAWAEMGYTTSGTYNICPDGDNESDVYELYCDMDHDGGGWTYVARGTYSSDGDTTDSYGTVTSDTDGKTISSYSMFDMI